MKKVEYGEGGNVVVVVVTGEEGCKCGGGGCRARQSCGPYHMQGGPAGGVSVEVKCQRGDGGYRARASRGLYHMRVGSAW
jgi:hypothetical protein